MISKAQRRRGAAWLFKAVRHDGLDYAQTDYEIQVIKDAKRKPSAHSIRSLPATESRITFQAGPATEPETSAPADTVLEQCAEDTCGDEPDETESKRRS